MFQALTVGLRPWSRSVLACFLYHRTPVFLQIRSNDSLFYVLGTLYCSLKANQYIPQQVFLPFGFLNPRVIHSTLHSPLRLCSVVLWFRLVKGLPSS